MHFSDILVWVVRIPYRIVKVEFGEDKLNTFCGVSVWSKGELTVGVSRVAGRVAGRRNATVTMS